MPKPKLGCNGFSLFAETMKPHLEEKEGRVLGSFVDLMKAAAPFWNEIDEEEKRSWKDRARSYKSSRVYQVKKQEIKLGKQKRKEKAAALVGAMGWGGAGEEDWMPPPDHADPDFCDPHELPGPICDPRELARSNPRASATAVHVGCVNSLDLVDGGKEGVRAALASLSVHGSSKRDSFHPIKHSSPIRNRKNVPPRFRSAAEKWESGEEESWLDPQPPVTVFAMPRSPNTCTCDIPGLPRKNKERKQTRNAGPSSTVKSTESIDSMAGGDSAVGKWTGRGRKGKQRVRTPPATPPPSEEDTTDSTVYSDTDCSMTPASPLPPSSPFPPSSPRSSAAQAQSADADPYQDLYGDGWE